MIWIFTALLWLTGCAQPPQETTEEEGRNTDSGLVEMSVEAQQHTGLQVATAKKQQLTEFLQVTGTVQPIDSRVSRIRPPARGRIERVNVRVGDRVREGQTIAEVNNLEATEVAADLASATAELQRLRIQLGTQTKQTERSRRLVEIGATPTKEYETTLGEQRLTEEAIKSQEAVIAGLSSRMRQYGAADADPGAEIRTSLQSPFAGVVVAVNAAPGELVDPEHELFTVTDLSQVWVQAEVYEKDLGRVRVGQSAFIVVDTYPNERFEGEVTYISDLLDPRTRTARVRCEVANHDMRLKLDMFANVQLPTTFSRETVAVPVASVQQVEDRNVVFVRRGNTTFEIRDVGVGRPIKDVVEITSGLDDGEPVVVEGAFHLKSIVMGGELGEE
jgi:cobalt-zinc-cadmium efflux system membrane fusion protein